jgi:hypothetical protein
MKRSTLLIAYGLFFTLLTATAAGCGYIDRAAVAVSGNATKSCVDGVSYLQFTSGATVQVDRAGKPVPC